MVTGDIEQRANTRLVDELNDVYTRGPITDPSRFSGREEQLELCRSRLSVPGMSFVIYGDRGLGKTSFANVLLARKQSVRVEAQDYMSFEQVLGKILEKLDEGWVIKELHTADKQVGKGAIKAPGVEFGAEVASEYGEAYVPISPARVDFDRVAEALARHTTEEAAVAIDEFHRLSATSQEAIGQLMHVLADRGVAVPIVVTGTAEWGEELMASREFKDYIDRNITAVRLPLMTPAELRDIIDKRARYGVHISDDVAADLVWVAGGYPAPIQSVMYDATVRWIKLNAAQVLGPLVTGIAKAVLRFSGLGRIADNLVIRRVELSKVGVSIGRAEIENELKERVKAFESAELHTYAFREAVSEPGLRAFVEAYALSDDDEFNLEAIAEQAGVSVMEARRLCTDMGARLFSSRKDLRPVTGLRPYVRAVLLLEGDPRVRGHALD
jgi:Cdc6-like AAA superfamily ATPase